MENRGPCGYFFVGESESDLIKANKTSRRVFGRPVDLVYLSKTGKVVVGDPVPAGEKLITSESNPPESFDDKSAPRAGRAAIKDAVREGLLRKATDADADAWLNAEIANAPKPDPKIVGQSRVMPRRPSIDNAYVVLKPFTFPAGLWIPTDASSSLRAFHGRKGQRTIRTFAISTNSKLNHLSRRHKRKRATGICRKHPTLQALIAQKRHPKSRS